MVQVSDGGLTDAITVNVTVNPTPTPSPLPLLSGGDDNGRCGLGGMLGAVLTVMLTLVARARRQRHQTG